MLKLTAMLLVVLGHVIMPYSSNGLSGPIGNFIWLNQIPLFFISSGMVATRVGKICSISQFSKKTAKNAIVLLWPFFTFLIIKGLITHTGFIETFRIISFEITYGLWYLFVLFFVITIFNFSIYLTSKINFKRRRFSFFVK